MDTCFDYRSVAQRAGLSADELRELEDCVRRQYGRDEMMIELRLLRTVQAIIERATTFRDAIQELSADGIRSRLASPPIVATDG